MRNRIYLFGDIKLTYIYITAAPEHSFSVEFAFDRMTIFRMKSIALPILFILFL